MAAAFSSNLPPLDLPPCPPSVSLFCLGKNGVMIPEIEWMNQVLLTVETVNSGSLIEITVFGQPRVQNRVRSVLLSLAARHRANRARGEALCNLHEEGAQVKHLAWPCLASFQPLFLS